MINIQFKFEAKIINSLKVVKFTRNHNFFKFKCKFDPEGQGQGHQFSNPSKTFRCSVNSSCWKVNAK